MSININNESLIELYNIIENIRQDQKTENLHELKDSLNRIYDTDKILDIIYTNNTDKLTTGVLVYPHTSYSDNIFYINTIDIEMDSIVFDRLDSKEILAILIYNLSNILNKSEDGYLSLLNAKKYLNTYIAENNLPIDTYYFDTLLIFAFEDIIIKQTNAEYINDDINLPESLIEPFISAIDKLYNKKIDMTNIASTNMNIPILPYMLKIYNNIGRYRIYSINLFKKCIYMTGSYIYTKAYKRLIDYMNTIKPTNESSIEDLELYFKENIEPTKFEIDLYEFHLIYDKDCITDEILCRIQDNIDKLYTIIKHYNKDDLELKYNYIDIYSQYRAFLNKINK